MRLTLFSLTLCTSYALAQSTYNVSATPESLPARGVDDRKYVIAHHIVGNTYPYTIDDWRKDVSAAMAYGIDGFALNVGRDPWEVDRVRDAYAAVRGTRFKLFMSLDMSSLPCAAPGDAVPLRKYVTDYATHPNQLIYRGRVLVTTFAGSDPNCNFGQGSVTAGWTSQFISQLTGVNRVWFVPAFFDDVSQHGTYNTFVDGIANWNSAWPTGLTAENIGSYRSNSSKLQTALSGRTADDRVHSTLSSQNIYIPTVSPWFFTHCGAPWNKNWIYYSDNFAYNVRWEALIANRAKFDIVQLLTWNDYGESTYVGAIAGAQPNSQAWTNNLEHTSWLPMTKYYADAFRAGFYPPLTRDRIYLICRPHARDAAVSSLDEVALSPPANYEMVEDKVWAIVFATKPAKFVLSTSTANTMTMDVPAGVTKASIAIFAGGYMRGQLYRGKGAQSIVDFKPNFQFQGSSRTYNFNAFVAVSR